MERSRAQFLIIAMATVTSLALADKSYTSDLDDEYTSQSLDDDPLSKGLDDEDLSTPEGLSKFCHQICDDNPGCTFDQCMSTSGKDVPRDQSQQPTGERKTREMIIQPDQSQQPTAERKTREMIIQPDQSQQPTGERKTREMIIQPGQAEPQMVLR